MKVNSLVGLYVQREIFDDIARSTLAYTVGMRVEVQ